MSGDLDTMWGSGLANRKLAFPRCAACRKWNWYPLPQCRHCHNVTFEWTEVRPVGRIFSWTRSHYDFAKGQRATQPEVIAIIEITDALEIRIPCRQTQAGEAPVIGETVQLEPALAGGGISWCYVPNAEQR